MNAIESLWGEEFDIAPKSSEKEKAKKVIEKISKPKEVKVAVEKKVKSSKLTLREKLQLITEEVLRVLGKQRETIVCVKDKAALHEYISNAIKNGRIAIDTETNNSLDPITCKLMGPCIYTPGEKQVYIPINHRDPDTQERLPWQLTEADVEEEFKRLVEANTYIVMHNGKFDYQVIKCTCNGLMLPINWDTMIGAKLLDENEFSVGLKQQYIDKIDPDQEKYSIEDLFTGVEYADVEPEIFALYAAHDAKMTDDLYEWQMNKFKDPDLAKVLNLAETVEMPLVQVVAEMELNGVEFDLEYDKLLSKKYHKKLEDLDVKIFEELDRLKPKIDAWRLTPDANVKPLNKKGTGEGKSKNEQLEDPIALSSPTQLAILLYDILGVGVIDKKSPRGTGEEILKQINLPLAELLLERRGIMKLITAFIDSLPENVNPVTGRIHCKFNAYGAATGRFSASEPNLQQIPSANHELRLLFRAGTSYEDVDCSDNEIICSSASKVMSEGKYVSVKCLHEGDIIDIDNEDNSTSSEKIKSIVIEDQRCRIVF